MTLKELTRQHEAFAAMQARKAEREAVKSSRLAAKQERERQWTLTKEHQRKVREVRERKADIRQQQRLEEDPRYHD